MAKEKLPKEPDNIEETTHYDDSLVRGSEMSNESRVNFSNPSSNLTENSISPISGNAGAEVNANKVIKPTPKVKPGNVVNVLLISAAASGSTILGTSVLLQTPSVSVSLFSRSSTTLTFQVDRTNIGVEDRLVASLSYQDEEELFDIYNINDEEPINEKFVTYEQLSEETAYTFKVYYYENFNAFDSEGNPLYDESVEPRALYSNTFVTANYADEVSIRLDEGYNHEELSFTIYNRTSLPFVSVRLVTESNKELLVKDTIEQEITYTLNDLPYDEDMYITVMYGDRGLAYQKVDAIPSEPIVPPEPEFEIAYNTNASNISYNKMELIFDISDYTKGESLKAYDGDTVITTTSSVQVDDTNQGQFIVFMDNLEPESLHEFSITDEEDNVIYTNAFSTDFIGKVVPLLDHQAAQVLIHQDLVDEANSLIDIVNYEYRVMDKDGEIIFGNGIYEADNYHEAVDFYGEETYTFTIVKYDMSGSETGTEEETLYSKTFTVDDASLRPLFYVEENVDLTVSYDHIFFWYTISDIDQIENMKFYLDDELCTIEEYDEESGYFYYNSPTYSPETTHEVKIYDKNDTLVFTNTYTLTTLVSVQPDSDLTMFQLDWNSEFLSNANFEIDNGTTYSFEISNKFGSLVCSDTLMSYDGSSNMQMADAELIYDGNYQLRILQMDAEEVETVYFEKSFTVTETRTYPTISTTISDKQVTFTLVAGDMPVGFDDGTRYRIEINCVETGYDTGIYFEYELDNPTILIFNLENGGIGGDPGSDNNEVNAGTYKFRLSCDDIVFYQGTFIIS